MYLTDLNISLPIGIGLWLVAIILLVNDVIHIKAAHALHRATLSRVRLFGSFIIVALIVLMRLITVSDNPVTTLLFMLLAMSMCVCIGHRRTECVLAGLITIQALAFADGGLLAIGTNIVNMAILPCSCGWLLGRSIVKLTGRRNMSRSTYAMIRVGVGAIVGYTLCELTSSIEMWLSRYAEAASRGSATFLQALQSSTAIFSGYRSPVAILVIGTAIVIFLSLRLRRHPATARC